MQLETNQVANNLVIVHTGGQAETIELLSNISGTNSKGVLGDL